MFTPTDIHILVGLLTRVTSPNDVEIMLGDRVFDNKADESRDVDVTITYKDASGNVSAFKGIDVKKHSRPLDVTHVEQLCIKLKDMPGITNRAIVSTSGYTCPARKKAQSHSVDLYRLIPWNNSAEGFEHVQFNPNFFIKQQSLSWVSSPSVNFQLKSQDPNEDVKINSSTPLCNITGEELGLKTIQQLADKLTSTALQHLIGNEEIKKLSLGVERCVIIPFNDLVDIYIVIGGIQKQLKQAWVKGKVIWKENNILPEFKILVKEGELKPYVGCAIAEMPQGNLIGFTVSQVDRSFNMINIPISDRNKNKIHKMRLK